MKTYWPTPLEKAAISAAICAGVKTMNWQTTSNPLLPSALYAAASLMSPRIARTLGGRSAAVAPRLKTLTSWPAATASTTQGSEILPAPPMKRIFRDMGAVLPRRRPSRPPRRRKNKRLARRRQASRFKPPRSRIRDRGNVAPIFPKVLKTSRNLRDEHDDRRSAIRHHRYGCRRRRARAGEPLATRRG